MPLPKRNKDEDVRKLSLLAQFDDLVRCSNQLSHGIESEFITYVKGEQENKSKQSNLKKEADRLRKDLQAATTERNKYDLKNKHMMLAAEEAMDKTRTSQAQKMALEKQIELIKELLLSDQIYFNDQAKEKLAFLNVTDTEKIQCSRTTRHSSEESQGSLPSCSDFSYDKTEDTLNSEQPDVTKHNLSNHPVSQDENEAVQEEDIASSADLDIQTSLRCEVKHMLNEAFRRSKRFYSEPIPYSEGVQLIRHTCKSDNDVLEELFNLEENKTDNSHMQSGSYSTPLRQMLSSRMNRAHVFCNKITFRLETCSACGIRMKLYKQVLKCEICKAICHPECNEKVTLPCVPAVQTPNKNVPGTIADYSPSTSPMIPSLLVYCIKEIEARELNGVALYRDSPYSGKEVKELTEKFLRGKCVPCLTKVNIHVLCGTVRHFLLSLNESIITEALRKDFILALELESEKDQFVVMKPIICQLPSPNRKTLSFLMLHLKSVSRNPTCKTSMEDLVKIFGPIIVGFSTGGPSETGRETEMKMQSRVLRLLLKAPTEYWNSFVFCGREENQTGAKSETVAEPSKTRHGTLRSGGSKKVPNKSSGIMLEKVPLPPRKKVASSLKSRRYDLNSPLKK